MRILFYSNWYVKQTISIANALAPTHDVMVVMPVSDPGAEDSDGVVQGAALARALDPRVAIARLNHMQGLTLWGLLAVCRAWWIARRFRPDVVHIQESYDFRSLLLRLTLSKLPFVLTVHDPAPHAGEAIGLRSFKHAVRDHARRMSDGLLVFGAAIRDDLVRVSGTTADRVHIVTHGPSAFIGPLASDRTPQAKRSKLILFFGRWEEYKGLDVLIRAAPLVWACVPDARFLIAGHGRLSIDDVLPDLTTRSRFEIRNYAIPDFEACELFLECEVVALPYREATQSGPLFIAASFARPVVASRVGAIAETLKDGETGVVVPPEDAEALARALISLLEHPEQARRIGINARMALGSEEALREVSMTHSKAYEAAISRRRSEAH